ncbi:MAG: LAGLIDADG family homing endonuclease, partial [Candidatus Woesearchaeota archaeon]
MTKINKIVMQGFKSFAKRTEILFTDNFNCIIGPNGAGKCVVGDSKVFLADGTTVRIADLIESKININPTKQVDDGFITAGDSTEILCIDTKTLKVRKRNIAAYVKRTSPKELVTITTKSGRTITSTPYHPFFILDGEQMVSIKADQLREGTRIAVPRSLPSPTTVELYSLIDEIKSTDHLYAPFKESYRNLVKQLKKGTYKELSHKIDVPKNAIKGLLDRQAINLAYLVRLMRAAGLSDQQITSEITHCKGKTTEKLCKIPWKNSGKSARVLGYLLAEGRLSNCGQIWFTNGCAEMVSDYTLLVQELFGVHTTVNEYKPGCWDVISYSHPMQVILQKLGMSFNGTKDKKITNLFLRNCSEENATEVLSGLYSGDGYVSNNSIELITKSTELAKSVELLLTRLDILHQSRTVIKSATNSGFTGKYRQITIYGAENHQKFAEKIRLFHPEKQMKVKSLVGKTVNPNVDLVEANRLIKNVAKILNINVKKTKKLFPRLDSYVYNQCIPSRYGINHLLHQLFIPKAASNFDELLALILIGQSDIFWDEIIEIEQEESNEHWVYDLCVEEDHNFVAENIFVHNSNVLDALCFVLGKASAKGLRAEKSSNLIYNGGKAKKQAKEGEVSIYFDNSKKEFPTEDPQVKISRIIMQNGQGKYKINDELRTRQQILDLLAMAKVDPDGYNIILQGDIVRFVEMSTVDRRLVIEDVSGIGIYEDKKQKALKELENVDAKLGEAEIILKERHTYLKELKNDRDQALKYKELNDRIAQNQASYLKIQMNKKEDEQKKFQRDHDTNKQAFEKKQEKVKHNKADIEKRQSETRELTKEVEEKGEKEQIQLQKEIEQIRVDSATAKTRQEVVENEIARISQRREQLNKNLTEVEGKTSELADLKKELEQEKNRIDTEQKTIQQKISTFKEKHNLGETSSIDQQMEKLDKDSEEIQKSLQKLREDQQELIRKKDRTEFQIQTIEGQIAKIKEIEKEHKKELEDIKQKRADFERTLKQLNKVLDEASGAAKSIREAETELFGLKEKREKLSIQQTRVFERKAGSLAVTKILEERKRFGAVHGTVAELGKVKSRYQQALEVAAGPRMNNVVVENDQVAEKCIQYLRQNKLGIATLLPLTKIKGQQALPNIEAMKKQAGVHGLAIELISFEPKYEKVFSYVFGSTLIVEDLATARKIGIGSCRMVTLQGDMVELSGAMQGGFRERRSTTFAEEDVSIDLGKAEAQIAKLETQTAKLRDEQQQNEREIEKLRELKANLEGEMIKAEKSLHIRPEDLQANQQYKEQLESEAQETDKTIKQAGEKIAEETRKLTDLKISRQKLKDKITQLRNPTLLAELTAFEQKQRELSERMANINAETKGIDMQIEEILGRDRENTTRILKEMDKEEKEFKKEQQELKTRITERLRLLKEKEASQEKFYARFKEIYAKRHKLTEEISRLEKENDDTNEKSRKEEYAMNTASLELARVKAELAGMQQEFLQYEAVELDLKKSEADLKKEIKEFEKMRETIGSVNMRALDIYEAVEKEYKSLVEKKERLIKEKEDVVHMMNEIETRKKELFMKNFENINEHFKSIFTMLSAKGDAYLELEDQENPFEQGVQIKVKITGSKFLDIRGLSGGEKTLTALAFIFSIQEYDPASFYILDEVDAALDKHNSEKL